MYVSDFQDSAGNQLLLIFICQLALGSLKEVLNAPSGQSIRRVLLVVVIVNLRCGGDTNSLQLVDNLREADKDSLHFMRCKASGSTDRLEKCCQLVGTTLTKSREWDNWVTHLDLMKMEQITEVHNMEDLKKTHINRLFCSLMSCRLCCDLRPFLNLVRECISNVVLNIWINVSMWGVPLTVNAVVLMKDQTRLLPGGAPWRWVSWQPGGTRPSCRQPLARADRGDPTRLPAAEGPTVTQLHPIRGGRGRGCASGQPNTSAGERGRRAFGSTRGPGDYFCILTKIVVLMSNRITLTYLFLTQLNTYLWPK